MGRRGDARLPRTWWRKAAKIEDQKLRPTVPTRNGNKRPLREKPVLKATGRVRSGPGDITDLYSPWRGKTYKAYSVFDIYSRQMVTWRVEEREADHLAVETFETARVSLLSGGWCRSGGGWCDGSVVESFGVPVVVAL